MSPARQPGVPGSTRPQAQRVGRGAGGPRARGCPCLDSPHGGPCRPHTRLACLHRQLPAPPPARQPRVRLTVTVEGTLGTTSCPRLCASHARLRSRPPPDQRAADGARCSAGAAGFTVSSPLLPGCLPEGDHASPGATRPVLSCSAGPGAAVCTPHGPHRRGRGPGAGRTCVRDPWVPVNSGAGTVISECPSPGRGRPPNLPAPALAVRWGPCPSEL